jgi:hypothetical protein
MILLIMKLISYAWYRKPNATFKSLDCSVESKPKWHDRSTLFWHVAEWHWTGHVSTVLPLSVYAGRWRHGNGERLNGAPWGPIEPTCKAPRERQPGSHSSATIVRYSDPVAHEHTPYGTGSVLHSRPTPTYGGYPSTSSTTVLYIACMGRSMQRVLRVATCECHFFDETACAWSRTHGGLSFAAAGRVPFWMLRRHIR